MEIVDLIKWNVCAAPKHQNAGERPSAAVYAEQSSPCSHAHVRQGACSISCLDQAVDLKRNSTHALAGLTAGATMFLIFASIKLAMEVAKRQFWQASSGTLHGAAHSNGR